MTEKLYAKDPYLKEFDAVVKRIDGNRVILDRTAFYPESGGQESDTGYLGSTRVIGTQYSEDKKSIVHLIEGEPDFNEGETVKGRLDWEMRYATMRLHAASHVMEHFLFEVFGKMRLAGTHVNEKHDSSTYESEAPLDPGKLRKVNELVNAFISKGHAIERWEDKEKPGWMHWKAGCIEMPCGGTHPRNTSEIGKVAIKRKNGGSGREKVLTTLAE